MRQRRRSIALCFVGIIWALVCIGVAVAEDAKPDPWERDIAALVANDAANPPPQHGVLFIGSSSIRFWTSLAQDFPGVPTINRGFGGSMIADSTRYVGRIVTPYHPSLIVMYAGDNDIDAGRGSQQVVDDFKAFVARVGRDLPATRVVYISIKPSVARIAKWPQMRAANEGIAAWVKTQAKVAYLDVASKMLDADGRPRAELLREDGLHLNSAGYAIWIEALKPLLARYGLVSRQGFGVCATCRQPRPLSQRRAIA